MRIIIPMAGMGSRMRPHTLKVPKPLLPVAGKPIVQRLVEDLASSVDEDIEEVAFVIGRFGEEVEKQLVSIAEGLGAKGSIYYQDEPLGTAHAILCAADSMEGRTIVAFADTLFKAQFSFDQDSDGVIWVHKVDDPSAFGVVQLDGDGVINDFVEKPEEFISDLAIIGVYYLKDGANLRSELQYLIDNDIRDKGEYQLTNALENMKNKGLKLQPGEVEEWLDCGNYKATVYTNQRVLENKPDEATVHTSVKQENVVIIPPCYIGEGAEIRNSVIGPHVSIGDGTKIDSCVISNSIIQSESSLSNCTFSNSMIGNHVIFDKTTESLSIGDYSTSK